MANRKRKTKEQQEQEARAALFRRVRDIAIGASRGDPVAENDGAIYGAAELCRFMEGLRLAFLLPKKDDAETSENAYLFTIANLDECDTVESTTDFLFRHDVRA